MFQRFLFAKSVLLALLAVLGSSANAATQDDASIAFFYGPSLPIAPLSQFDRVVVYQRAALSPEATAAQVRGVTEIIKSVHSRFPGVRLLFNRGYLRLFYIDVVAAGLQVLLLAILNIFFYLDQRRITLILSVVFLLANSVFTLLTQISGSVLLRLWLCHGDAADQPDWTQGAVGQARHPRI